MRTLLALLLLCLPVAAEELLHDHEWTCHQIVQVHIDKGRDYTPGIYRDVALNGGNGSGARADLTVGPNGSVDDVRVNIVGRAYAMGDRLTAELPGGSGFLLIVEALTDFHPAMLRRDVKSRVRASMMGRNPCFATPKGTS